MPGDLIVEAHGAFHTAHCVECHREYSHQWVKGRCWTGALCACVCGVLVSYLKKGLSLSLSLSLCLSASFFFLVLPRPRVCWQNSNMRARGLSKLCQARWVLPPPPPSLSLSLSVTCTHCLMAKFSSYGSSIFLVHQESAELTLLNILPCFFVCLFFDRYCVFRWKPANAISHPAIKGLNLTEHNPSKSMPLCWSPWSLPLSNHVVFTHAKSEKQLSCCFSTLASPQSESA